MKSQEGDQQAETDSTRPARRTSSTEQSRRARSRTRREARAMSDNSKTGMKSSENDSSANLDTSINLNELRDAAQKHNEDNNNNTKRRSNSNSPTRNNNSSNNNSRSFRDRSRSPRNSPTRSRHYQGRRGRQSPSRQKSPSQKSPPRRRQSSRSRPRERSLSPPVPAETNNRRPGLAPPSGGPPRRASLTLESVFGREIKPKPAFDVLTTITGTSAESNDSSVEPESATTEVLQFDPTNATSVTSFVRDEKDSNTSGVFKMESLSESRHGESRHGKDREHNDRRSSSNQSYLPGNMDVSQRGGSNNNQSRSNLRRSSRRDSSRSRSRSQSRSKSRQRRRPSTSSYKDEASVARQQRRASLTLENVFRMEEKSLLDDSNADSQSTMAREAGYGSKRIRRRDRERNRLRSRDQQLDEKINNALLLDSEQYPYIPQNMAAGQSSKEPDSPLLGGDQSDMERSMGDSLASESSFATCDEDEAGGMKKHRKTPLAAMSYLKQLRRSSFVSKSQDSATTDSMLETSSFHESGDSGKDDKKESTSIKKKVKNLLRGKSKKHLQMLGQDDSEHSQDDGEIH